MSRVLAIVNPVAGRQSGIRLRAAALAELRRLVPDIEVCATECPGQATELARQAAAQGSASGPELVISVGGDGTAREVATGLIGTRTCLGIVPVGSGNDLSKTLGIPRRIIPACRLALQGSVRTIDVACLETGAVVHHFINAAGFGFDAAVVAQAKKLRRLKGLSLYLAAVLRTVSSYQCPLVRIRTQDRAWEQHILLLAAANGRYYGGGMKIAPTAEPDDGQLDFCIIDAVGRLTILRYLPSFVRGTHIRLDVVTMLCAPELELELLEPTRLQLDGDLLPLQNPGRFRIRVLPQALQVIT